VNGPYRGDDALKRRDKIVAHLEARAKELGEDEAFVP